MESMISQSFVRQWPINIFHMPQFYSTYWCHSRHNTACCAKQQHSPQLPRARIANIRTTCVHQSSNKFPSIEANWTIFIFIGRTSCERLGQTTTRKQFQFHSAIYIPFPHPIQTKPSQFANCCFSLLLKFHFQTHSSTLIGWSSGMWRRKQHQRKLPWTRDLRTLWRTYPSSMTTN